MAEISQLLEKVFETNKLILKRISRLEWSYYKTATYSLTVPLSTSVINFLENSELAKANTNSTVEATPVSRNKSKVKKNYGKRSTVRENSSVCETYGSTGHLPLLQSTSLKPTNQDYKKCSPDVHSNTDVPNLLATIPGAVRKCVVHEPQHYDVVSTAIDCKSVNDLNDTALTTTKTDSSILGGSINPNYNSCFLKDDMNSDLQVESDKSLKQLYEFAKSQNFPNLDPNIPNLNDDDLLVFLVEGNNRVTWGRNEYGNDFSEEELIYINWEIYLKKLMADHVQNNSKYIKEKYEKYEKNKEKDIKKKNDISDEGNSKKGIRKGFLEKKKK